MRNITSTYDFMVKELPEATRRSAEDVAAAASKSALVVLEKRLADGELDAHVVDA